MNLWQLLRQAQYLARAARWPDTTTPVFHPSSVLIVPTPTEDQAVSLSSPVLALYDLGSQADEEEPEIETVQIGATLAVCVPSSAYGEGCIVGANRSANSSAGRGLLEIEAKLKTVLGSLVTGDGARLFFVDSASNIPQEIAGRRLVISKELRFRARAVVRASYAAPRKLVATAGTGQVAFTWELPPTRFDTRRIVLRRASGSTPPSSITDGTGVTLGGSPDGSGVTSKTVTGLSAGAHSFALFATYDEFGSSTDEQSSAAVTATVTVT